MGRRWVRGSEWCFRALWHVRRGGKREKLGTDGLLFSVGDDEGFEPDTDAEKVDWNGAGELLRGPRIVAVRIEGTESVAIQGLGGHVGA